MCSPSCTLEFTTFHFLVTSVNHEVHIYVLSFICSLYYFLHRLYFSAVGRDSSVGIATRYRLDGLMIESRWGRDFPHHSISALGPTQSPVKRVPGPFAGDKAAGAWR
jgi:hypothetical protein